MRTRRILIGIGTVTCLAMATASAGAAEASSSAASAWSVPGTVLDLELNESAGSTVALDSSGMRHDGAIGSHIRMNGSYAD